MPENPAGLGWPEEKIVHFTKMVDPPPYEKCYQKLKGRAGWKPSGIWHIKCRLEVYINGDTEMCGCGASGLDIVSSLERYFEPITKLF